LPVLARILIDQGILHTHLGTVAISAAAVDDVIAWSMLALVISLLSSGVNSFAALEVFAVLISYAAFLLFVVKPLYAKFADYMTKRPSGRGPLFAYTAMLIFVSAFFTEALGVHAVFGGFLMGLAMPRVFVLLFPNDSDRLSLLCRTPLLQCNLLRRLKNSTTRSSYLW
jgi:Kef-type K+ transport system membrane component KefB